MSAIRLKPVLTGELEVTVDFCQASLGDCLSLGLNGTTCITANVKMSQHFIVGLIIHSPPSPACHRLRKRERERAVILLLSSVKARHCRGKKMCIFMHNHFEILSFLAVFFSQFILLNTPAALTQNKLHRCIHLYILKVFTFDVIFKHRLLDNMQYFIL